MKKEQMVKNDVYLVSILVVFCVLMAISAYPVKAYEYPISEVCNGTSGYVAATVVDAQTGTVASCYSNELTSCSASGNISSQTGWYALISYAPPQLCGKPNPCGASPCYLVTDVVDMSEPTPTPTPTPIPDGACICSAGYCFSQGNIFSGLGAYTYLQSEAVLAGTGQYASSAFYWLASTLYPCSEATAANATNETPYPTAVTTYPTAVPTYPSSMPGSGEPNTVIVDFGVTPGATIDSVISIENVTLPENVSIPILPTALPTLPAALNTTNYRENVNSTPFFGQLFVGWLSQYDSLTSSYFNILMVFLYEILMPFTTLTDQIVVLTENFNSILLAWTTSASLITALMWYSFMSIPPKAMNVFFIALAIDVIEQILEWPTEL